MTDPVRTNVQPPRAAVSRPTPRPRPALRAAVVPSPTLSAPSAAQGAQTAVPLRLGTGASAGASSDSIRAFIELEMEARQCANLDSLRFVIANGTRKVAAFDQALLVEPKPAGGWHITCASSVHKIDAQTPLVRFFSAWLDRTSASAGIRFDEARTIDLTEDARAFELPDEVGHSAHAFWLPIKSRDGRLLAALLALKQEPWPQQSSSVLLPLAGAYAHAWAALAPAADSPARRALRFVTKRRLALAAILAAALAAFIPVPMSSLAPAEIVAAEPALIAAPLDGVIQDIAVVPGTQVATDQILITFNDTRLKSEAEVARRNMQVAQARYFKIIQAATANRKETEDLAIAKSELDVASAELAAAKDLLARSVVRAPRAGLAIYSAKSDWIGRPVHTGERIMDIGDPAKTELRIEMPVADAISLTAGGPVALFLDGDPLTAIDATITRISYRPVLSAERQLVYKVHAKLDAAATYRIGLRGIARTSNGDVPLWFYLLRRPIASLRQRFGL